DRQLQELKVNNNQSKKNGDQSSNEIVMVMVHHNVAEHIPNQSTHPLGQRYILPEAVSLQNKLRDAGVKLIFTGHLHVQNIVDANGLFAVTTGSLIAYPHPYRILTLYEVNSHNTHSEAEVSKQRWLDIESHTIKTLPNWEDLTSVSRQWTGDHSGAFMTQLLAKSSLNLSLDESEFYSQEIQYLWADTARGDQQLSFPNLPRKIRDYCENFGVRSHNNQLRFCDNHIALKID
ncbi:MAG: metallophosphoesterase, partial [Cyanobacteria bacterium P01_F01_bin.153]